MIMISATIEHEQPMIRIEKGAEKEERLQQTPQIGYQK